LFIFFKEHKKIGDFIKILPADVNNRARIVIRTIVNYCFELLTRDENMSLPEYLEPSKKSNLWVTMLFNDEVHTYEQVNHSLLRAIGCTQKQAMDYATIIDREGRSVIKCGQFLECNSACTILDTMTRRPGPKPLKCHVMELELVAHQNFVIRLLQWLKQLIDKGQVFAMIYGTEMLRKPPLWKRTKNKSESSLTSADIGLELADSVSTANKADRDGHGEVFASNMYACTSLLEMVMRTDAQVWKTPRKLWHELFIRGMFLQETLKREFAKRFTRQYVQLQADFIEDDHDVLFSITDLAIQFYSVPTVAIAMIEQEDALHRVGTAFLNEFSLHFDSKLQTFRRETSVTQRFRRAHFILSDFRRLLGVLPNRWSKKLTKNFLHGFETFMRLLEQMQDMDSVVRQVGQHVEFEPDWDTGIDLQNKVGRIIFKLVEWASSHPSLLPKCIRITLRYLQPKLRAFNVIELSIQGAKVSCIPYDVSCYPVSVHLPLTRLACALLLELKRHQPKYDPKNLRPWLPATLQPLHPLTTLMEHSLRTLVLVAQFRAGIWRRNGYSLVNQVFFYHSTHMRDEMYDRDVQLLQLAGAHLEPDEFMFNLLNRFFLLTWFEKPRFTPEDKQQFNVTLLEEFLGLLLLLLSERHVPGVGIGSNEDRVKKEIIQRLCIENLSHSDLLRHFSRHSTEMNVEHLISEVAVFNGQPGQPGGKYELRTEHFNQFNPFFYHYTRQDQCSAEESQLKRKRQINERFVCCPPPLPPEFTAHFRPLLKLFSCDVMISSVRMILELATDEPTLWYTETLFEKSMHLVGLGLLEQERELNALLTNPESTSLNMSNFFMLDYLDKLKVAKIFQLLVACEPNCKINSYTQLRLWLDERAQQVAQLKERFDRQVKGDAACDLAALASRNAAAEATVECAAAVSVAQEKPEQTARARNSELAAQRRTRIMAQMAAMQNKFIQTNAAYFDPEPNSAEASGSKSASEKTKNGEESIDSEMEDESCLDDGSCGAPVAIGAQIRGQFIRQEMHQCILCREEQSQEEGACMVMAAFVQRSTVLSKNRSRPATIGAFCGELVDFCLPSDLHYGVHVSSCGHLMHSKCWSAFFSAVLAKERRRPMRFGRQIIYDAEKNEYLCPLCGCLSNSIIPMITADAYRRLLRSNASQGVKVSVGDLGEALCSLSGEAKHYWVKFLSNGSVSTDVSGNEPTVNSGKQCFFRRYSPCEMDKAVEALGEDSRKAICRLLSVYQQQDLLENTLSSDLRELMSTLATRIFCIGVGCTPPEHDDRGPLLTYATCAFTIQCVERTQRLEGKSMFADLSSRRYNCLQVLVRFVCLSSVLFLQEQLKSCSIRLLQQLLIPRHYNSCSRSCLDLDAFGLLITLVCVAPSIYAEETSSKVKPVMPLGNAFDQQILHIVFMFHIVQV
jgi:E3 ubiquitin-protein ligase UBR2